MQKPDILGIQEYSEPFHNYILTYIQNPVIFTKIYEYSELALTYLKPDKHAEPSQRFKMEEFFAKIVENYNNFSKALHLRSLTEF